MTPYYYKDCQLALEKENPNIHFQKLCINHRLCRMEASLQSDLLDTNIYLTKYKHISQINQ